MQKEPRSRLRRMEVITGLIFILVGFSFVSAMLLDFDLGSPYSTLLDDLAYLSDHSLNQKLSAWAWLSTAFITVISIPFYLYVFHKRLTFLQYINGLFMLGAAGGVLMVGLVGLEINQMLTQDLVDGIEQTNEQLRIEILQHFKEERSYTVMAGVFTALFAIGLGATRFKVARFPLFSTIFLVISGPVLIFFYWYNPEHILQTAAMAGMMIGLIIFCVRLINKGMSPP